MILAVNIGNSSLRFGIFEGRDFKTGWTLQTKPFKSSDEYVIAIHSMFIQHKLDLNQIEDIIIASVVPPLAAAIRDAVKELFGRNARFINYRMKSGLSFPIEQPSEMGADLLSNAAAAYNLYHKDVIVADFGTATSFTIVRENGFLPGIVIAPGVISALGSLFADTSQLPQIELKVPDKVIGIDTVGCIQSGIIYGWAGLLDNIVRKIDEEQGTRSMVIITGGAGRLFEKVASRADLYDPHHTIRGLQLLHELNRD
ncbi:MAG: type III pantothenate kinase [Spirochaetales bacterium]|nr:type III pantothenate kinase [Spirochaetales bacterium]